MARNEECLPEVRGKIAKKEQERGGGKGAGDVGDGVVREGGKDV